MLFDNLIMYWNFWWEGVFSFFFDVFVFFGLFLDVIFLFGIVEE